MISCPGENILSVSSMMRSLYTGHKFHSWTLATAVLAFCKQLLQVLPGYSTWKSPHRSFFSPPLLRLLHWAVQWNGGCFSTTLSLARSNSSHVFSQFDHDKEHALWNYLHLLKLSVRSVVQLMKSPGSTPLSPLAIHPEMETQVSIPPLVCKLKSRHHVNSLVTENHAWRKSDPCFTSQFTLDTFSIYSALKWWHSFRCTINLLAQLSWK